MPAPDTTPKALLLVGASRGLGLAMAEEYAGKGWSVVGTVRGYGRTGLHDLADRVGGRIGIEMLDITEPDGIADLRGRLAGRMFDTLFVNAGTTNANQGETIGQVSTEEFVRVMITNALGPLRVIEGLDSLVRPDGLIGVMSSGQGSITNNTRGMREVYRGSKAALNQYMRSYAARHAGGTHPMVLMAPGWVRTELGGEDAPLTLKDSVPSLVEVLLTQTEPGLR